jgi:hypothetical protein
MTIINLENVFSNGSAFYPEFKQVFGYNTETRKFIMEKDILDKTPVEVNRVFNPYYLTMYVKGEKATPEEIATYFNSLGLIDTLENIPFPVLEKIGDEKAKEPLKELLTKLLAINDGSLVVETHESDGYTFIKDDEGDLEGLCWSALYPTGNGMHINSKNALKQNGFKVFPLEKDSFGWLIGAVTTNKGIITFG